MSIWGGLGFVLGKPLLQRSPLCAPAAAVLIWFLNQEDNLEQEDFWWVKWSDFVSPVSSLSGRILYMLNRTKMQCTALFILLFIEMKMIWERMKVFFNRLCLLIFVILVSCTSAGCRGRMCFITHNWITKRKGNSFVSENEIIKIKHMFFIWFDMFLKIRHARYILLHFRSFCNLLNYTFLWILWSESHGILMSHQFPIEKRNETPPKIRFSLSLKQYFRSKCQMSFYCDQQNSAGNFSCHSHCVFACDLIIPQRSGCVPCCHGNPFLNTLFC